MFILTAKLDKRKTIIIAAAVILIIAAAVIILERGSKSAEDAALVCVVRTNDERVDYLASLGWEVEEVPLDEQTILIPQKMDESYSDYNSLQNSQGFDLGMYGGLEATRYTYKVLNYPEKSNNIVADIVVYRNEIIAGDVQSTALDGFMHGLSYPG